MVIRSSPSDPCCAKGHRFQGSACSPLAWIIASVHGLSVSQQLFLLSCSRCLLPVLCLRRGLEIMSEVWKAVASIFITTRGHLLPFRLGILIFYGNLGLNPYWEKEREADGPIPNISGLLCGSIYHLSSCVFWLPLWALLTCYHLHSWQWLCYPEFG